MKLSTTLLHLAAAAATASAAAVSAQHVLGSRPAAAAEPDDARGASPLRLPLEALKSGVKALLEAVAGDGTGEAEVVCFCSGGVICCDGPEGSACDYGTCGA